MSFAETQSRQLAGKLSQRHVKTREQQGRILSYVEGWHVIAEANRIFGFDGWDREMIWSECVWQDARSANKACAYAARVRIRVRAGDTVVFRDGSGAGHGSGATLGEAHESALKEAETDATKRAFTTFGNLFGLALYDKEQTGVRRTRERKRSEGEPLVVWALHDPNGVIVGTHEKPQDFCRFFKESIASAPTLEALRNLWERNAIVLMRLRASFPDLKTAKGTHYADVLSKHYERRLKSLEEIVSANPQSEPETPEAAIDKSELMIAVPKRIRDEDHLRFVASQACLVCGRTPVHAHHLRFAQLRSMGSKVSDEWAVPVCHLHHRALHDVGSEEGYWRDKGIDAKAEAERLWDIRRLNGDRSEQVR